MAKLHDKLKDKKLRRASGLQTGMAIVLRIHAAFEITLAALSALMIWFFWTIANGQWPLSIDIMEFAEHLDLVVRVTAIGFLITFFTSAVMVGRFTYRSMKNLHITDAVDADMSPQGTFLWHFVPIAFLLMPFSGMAQIWKGSKDPAGSADHLPAIMRWWWAAWIVSLILSNISFRLSGGFGEPDSQELLEISLWLDVVSGLTGATAALLLANFTKQIVINQDATINFEGTNLR